MDKDKKVPDIRFSGFEGEWESTQLKDFSQKVISKNISLSISTVFTNSAEYGIIDQREYFDRNVANDSSINGYYVVEPNDFVYNPRISTSAPVGPINRNKYCYTGVISPLYYVFKTNESIDLTYLDVYFKSTMWHSFMYMNGNSGARSDRFSISDEVFAEMPISYPQTKDEQEKIGKLFTTIDKLIRQLEAKLEKLRRIKQSLLQQMFINVNRGGYTVAPQIRFAGFNEPWTMTTLRQITDRVVRKNLNNESNLPLTISSQYGLIDQSTFFNSRIASKDISGYYLIKNGEFAYNKSSSDGYPFGSVKRLDKYDKGVLSTLYVVFKVKLEKVCSDYLVTYYDTRLWHDDVSQRAAEGARNHGLLNISANDFFETSVFMPEIDEQQQIAKIVFDLDNIILSEDKRLSCVLTMKQSLLQKMFV